MIANGKIVIGNDGGVYSRPLSDTPQYGDWTDLNATCTTCSSTTRAPASCGRHGQAVWGGLQDNGTSLLASGQSQTVEPAGGDGFDVIVDPPTPTAWSASTPTARCTAPPTAATRSQRRLAGLRGQATVGQTPQPELRPDDAVRHAARPGPAEHQHLGRRRRGRVGHHDGWNTTCTSSGCSWQNGLRHRGGQRRHGAVVGEQRPGHLRGVGRRRRQPGPGVRLRHRHQLRRHLAPDQHGGPAEPVHRRRHRRPANPAHAYAMFNGYSRRWIPGGGVGHVFETNNGGRVVARHLGQPARRRLRRAGARGRPAGAGHRRWAVHRARRVAAATPWSRLGTGLPNASVNDVTPGPDGYIYAATHGRGIWRLPFGSHH